MTQRCTLPILLALALLLAQTAGYIHALSHYNADQLVKERIAHASMCAKCASFDKLAPLIPTSFALRLRVESSTAPRIKSVRDTPRRTPSPFQSRAPPHFA
jgi:hypothetical protein